MSFMDEFRKLTQPYGDDDDFYEGADEAFAVQAAPPASAAQQQFESAFAGDDSVKADSATKKKRKPVKESQPVQKPSRPASKRGSSRNESQVILFNPKDFDEAGELAVYLRQGRSLVMALEGLPVESARRLLDFISGIAFALNAKITPVSAKTYFVTPENVDLLSPSDLSGQSEDDEY